MSDFFELGVDGCCFCYSHVKLGCFHFVWMTAFFLQAMADVLSTNAAMKRLNLDKCGIGDAGAEARRLYFAAAKGSRPEGSRGWTWVRLVGECGRLRLRLTITFLRRFFVTSNCF